MGCWEELSLHSLYKGECAHRGPGPPAVTPTVIPGWENSSEGTLPFYQKRETTNSPTFQDNYTHRLYLQDLPMESTSHDTWPRCSRKFVDGILSPGGKGNWRSSLLQFRSLKVTNIHLPFLSAMTPSPQNNVGEKAVPCNGFAYNYKGDWEVLQRDAVCLKAVSLQASSRASACYWLRWEDSTQIFVLGPDCSACGCHWGVWADPWEGLDSPSWILAGEKHSFSHFRELWRTLTPHTPVGPGASLRGTDQPTSAGATRDLPCSELSLTARLLIFKKGGFRDFPGGPVDKSLSFQCRRAGFDP